MTPLVLLLIFGHEMYSFDLEKNTTHLNCKVFLCISAGIGSKSLMVSVEKYFSSVTSHLSHNLVCPYRGIFDDIVTVSDLVPFCHYGCCKV